MSGQFRVRHLVTAAGLIASAIVIPAPPAGAQQGKGEAPYVPTPQVVVDAMLKLGKVASGDYVIDLGSGDGRIVITAAKLGAKGLGVDLDAALLKLASDTARQEGLSERAAFRRENLFRTDLTPATVVTTYLLPDMNLKLRPKILALAPGTRLVTHDYHMGEWPPDDRLTLHVPEKKVGAPGIAYVYLWIVPSTVAGRWRSRLSLKGRPTAYEFDLRQRFQSVSGSARVGGETTPVRYAQLTGDQLSFALNARAGGMPMRQEFHGRVKGNTIDGTLTVSDGSEKREIPWSAALVEPGKRDEP